MPILVRPLNPFHPPPATSATGTGLGSAGALLKRLLIALPSRATERPASTVFSAPPLWRFVPPGRDQDRTGSPPRRRRAGTIWSLYGRCAACCHLHRAPVRWRG